MTIPQHDVSMVRSFDGTLIAARRFGPQEGYPLLISNAVGANLHIWGKVIEGLAADRPVIAWDMRGTFESGLPASHQLDATAHARDALAVSRHLGVERFHLAAWSSGGRIALQITNDYPERVGSLALVCAGYGHALGALLRLDLPAILPRLAGATRLFAGPIHAVLKRALSRPEIVGLVRQSGMVGASADTAAFIEFLKGIGELDARILFETYHAVSGDAGADLLRHVVAPTLVIAGEHDQFTSRSVTTEVLAKIPDARLEVYDDSTHYLPIEQPTRLAYDLGRFFKEVENTLS